MKSTIKPGTRCECYEGACEHEAYEYSEQHQPSFRCMEEAVRMVEMRQVAKDAPAQFSYDVPMCAPCAEYHEARQKAGAR